MSKVNGAGTAIRDGALSVLEVEAKAGAERPTCRCRCGVRVSDGDGYVGGAGRGECAGAALGSHGEGSIQFSLLELGT